MRAIVFLMTALLATSALAVEVQAFKVDDVIMQQQQIRADLEAGKGRYADFTASQRNDILRNQDMLFSLVRGKESSAELNEDQYMRVFTILESIEASVNKETDQALVCTREKTIGSNRTTRVCRTRAQMEAQRELARRQLNQGVDQLRR